MLKEDVIYSNHEKLDTADKLAKHLNSMLSPGSTLRFVSRSNARHHFVAHPSHHKKSDEGEVTIEEILRHHSVHTKAKTADGKRNARTRRIQTLKLV